MSIEVRNSDRRAHQPSLLNIRVTEERPSCEFGKRVGVIKGGPVFE